MGYRSKSLFLLIFVLAVSAVFVVRDTAPSLSHNAVPPDAFSVSRALTYLNSFAIAPHPLGSAEHDRVRDYLVAQMTSLGVTPEVQRATGVTPRYEVAGTVENIVGRLKGTNGAPDAVALVAHYDSVPSGPGAGDDGAGVAALLDTLRALRAGPALKNDVIFLLTDGEEDGLLGASAFVAEHPWAKDVRVVLNFEARGNSGASQMFETSAGNGRLVQIFADASPHPNGSSLTHEIYQHMPNDTDMTVFKRSGDAGLNFAFIGNWEAYHTPLDTPGNLDLASLQQHGENALALARAFGNASLDQLKDRDDVYFSLPGNLFARYSSSLVWPLAFVCGVLLLGVIFYAKGAWEIQSSAIFGSFFIHIIILVILWLAGLGFVTGVHRLYLRTLPEGPLDQNDLYTLGLFALLAAVAACLYGSFRKRIAPAAFFLGGALLIFVLLLATTLFLPGGSNYFVWPLVAGLLATILAAFRSSHLSYFGVLILCLLSLPALALYVPALKGFYNALGFTHLGAQLLAVAFGIFFLLLFPFLDPILETRRKLFPLTALAASIVLCVFAAQTTRYSAAHPKPSQLSYALDADTGKAEWASSVRRVDSWTAEYLGASAARERLADFAPDWYPLSFFVHDAPAISLAAPQVTLVEKSDDGATRTLHLRVTSPRHARTIHVSVGPAEVLNASVNSRDLGQPSQARWHQIGHWGFDYANPGDGVDLQLHVQGTQPITVVLVDRSSGLPVIPGAAFPRRPADSMPIHSGDQTMVRRSFVF